MEDDDKDKPFSSHVELPDPECVTPEGLADPVVDPFENYVDYLEGLQSRSSTPWAERVLKYIRHPFDYKRLNMAESMGLFVADFCEDGDVHCNYTVLSDDIQLHQEKHGEQRVVSRVIVSEDLSPKAIEFLGSMFKIQSDVFYDHLAVRDTEIGDCRGFDQKAFRVTSSQIRHSIASLDDTVSLLVPCEMTASASVRPGWEPAGYYNVYHAHEDNIKSAGLGYLRPQWMSSFKHTSADSLSAQNKLYAGSMDFLFESYKRITIHKCIPSTCQVPTC